MNECIDMTGKKIGWWSVLERTDAPTHITSHCHKQAWWLCRCKCGTERPILGGALRSGKTKSCGCRCFKKNSKHANIKTKFPVHHGFKKTALYGIHHAMLLKCYQQKNSHFKNYGAQGITVCDKWRRITNFVSWAKEMWKPNYSLELKEGEKMFSPDTCYWIPKADKISTMKKKNGKKEYRNLLGKTFGSLSVLKEKMILFKDGYRRTRLECICRCGKTSLVSPHSLVSGRTKTCGCTKNYDWSRNFKECIVCNQNNSRHAGKGVCFRCYQRKRNENGMISLKDDVITTVYTINS